MPPPTSPADILRGQIADHCQELAARLKLLRDYATTPGDVWLARGELNQIAQHISELEGLLAQLKEAD
jgi:hypothetical protein